MSSPSDLSPKPEKPAAEQAPSPAPASEPKPADVADEAVSPILRKPPARPVRPQPPAELAAKPPMATKPAASKPEAAKPEIVSVVPAAATVPTPAPMDVSLFRQQPIPPPSEPKQYRAIGMVKGIYTPAGEEFTIGELQTADGTTLKAVLLGRVMSLVKNHIDLEKQHLWIVYPRTRDEEKELHIQIVGIWEPETLKKEDEPEEETPLTAEAELTPGAEVDAAGETGDRGATPEATTAEAATEVDVDAAAESTVAVSAPPAEPDAASDLTFADPRLVDGYFSIRGEVVFYAEDDHHIVVKIQQTPRKNTQKAKAFKISVRGQLSSPRSVGYFWELHTLRQDNTLAVTESVCIGLAPPKKRSKDDPRDRRRPPFGRGKGPGRPQRAGGPRPNWEAGSGGSASGSSSGSPKPVKRTEQQPSES